MKFIDEGTGRNYTCTKTTCITLWRPERAYVATEDPQS